MVHTGRVVKAVGGHGVSYNTRHAEERDDNETTRQQRDETTTTTTTTILERGSPPTHAHTEKIIRSGDKPPHSDKKDPPKSHQSDLIFQMVPTYTRGDKPTAHSKAFVALGHGVRDQITVSTQMESRCRNLGLMPVP